MKEEQTLKEDNIVTDTIRLIRGFAFILEDGREIAFEKTDPFSEEIAITRGHDLVSKFKPSTDEEEDWGEGNQLTVKRSITII